MGAVCALLVPGWLGIAPRWGAAGLSAASGFAGWIEFVLLRRSLAARIGPTGLPVSYLARLWLAAILGAAIGWGVRLALPPLGPILRGALVLPAFGVTYLGMVAALGIAIPGLRRR
jgi:putative peptidoglycan lipid II flippase